MADDTQSQHDRLAVHPIPPQESTLVRSTISKSTDFLLDNNRIGYIKHSYDKHRRYATLDVRAMFATLITLYTPLFITQWPHFRRFMDAYPAPPGIQPWTYMTRVYISVWIHDLYPSIREAVKKLSPLAFSQHYNDEIAPCSYEYDDFLVRINAAIRPTHIKGCLEDTLFIPLLSNNIIDWTADSPLAIPGWSFNYDIFIGIITIMKDRKIWRISETVTNTLGRPFWLFDWHTDDRCCSWFPTEGNYNMDDVTLAYILGVACTPKLGPQDVDDWQDFPDGIVPAQFNPSDYDRVLPRRFFGAYECTTYITENIPTNVVQPRAKRGRSTKSSTAAGSKAPAPTGGEPSDRITDEEEVEALPPPKFRLTTWTYYALVVIVSDIHTRSGALKMMVFN